MDLISLLNIKLVFSSFFPLVSCFRGGGGGRLGSSSVHQSAKAQWHAAKSDTSTNSTAHIAWNNLFSPALSISAHPPPPPLTLLPRSLQCIRGRMRVPIFSGTRCLLGISLGKISMRTSRLRGICVCVKVQPMVPVPDGKVCLIVCSRNVDKDRSPWSPLAYIVPAFQCLECRFFFTTLVLVLLGVRVYLHQTSLSPVWSASLFSPP